MIQRVRNPLRTQWIESHRGVADGMIPQEARVSDVMTADVRSCSEDETIEQVGRPRFLGSIIVRSDRKDGSRPTG